MARFRILWSPQASDDLKDIYQYIYQVSPNGADIVFETLVDLVDSLQKYPERFPVEPALEEYDKEFRFIPKWNYKIIYRVNHIAKLVIIARIFGTRQGLDKLTIE